MSRSKIPMNWTAAVATVLGERDPQREQAFDADADEVFKALQALIATGRCLATASHGSYLPLTGVRRTAQSRMGFNGKAHRDTADLKNMAIAFEGPQGSWIANVARLTYLPPRRGAPAEKAVFHALLGERHGSPFINDADVPEPQLHLAKGAWVLLTEADLDVPSLLRGDVDPADLDSLGEAVRGRPRASYVPMDERLRKEAGLAAVKDAYLFHRGPTPRALQQDDIDVIVRSGLEHGLLINLDLVHAATDNRGSPNAVYPKLADAMRRLAPGRTTADDVDPTLTTLWEQLRAAAVASADELLAPQRTALEAERATLTAANEQLAAERDQDARAAAERQRQHERLEQELAQARERIESLTNVERGQASEIASLSAERGALRNQLAERTEAMSALQAELGTVRETRDAFKATLDQCQRDALAAQEQAGVVQQKHSERIAELEVEIDTQRQHASRSSAAHRDVVGALERTTALLDTTRDAAERSAERIASLEAELTAATRQHGLLEGQLLAGIEERRRLTEQLAQADTLPGRIEALTEQLARVTAEHDRLVAERDAET